MKVSIFENLPLNPEFYKWCAIAEEYPLTRGYGNTEESAMEDLAAQLRVVKVVKDLEE